MSKEQKTIQETVGKFIHDERKRQKMSLANLAFKVYGNMGSQTRIGNIEKGIIKDCSINTISLILEALGFDMRDLFKR